MCHKIKSKYMLEISKHILFFVHCIELQFHLCGYLPVGALRPIEQDAIVEYQVHIIVEVGLIIVCVV